MEGTVCHAQFTNLVSNDHEKIQVPLFRFYVGELHLL